MSRYLEWKKRALFMGAGGWWVPNLYSPSDCVCAYLFKGAAQSDSLLDLTGNGYDMPSPSLQRTASFFSASEGWTLYQNDVLDNTDVTGAGIGNSDTVKSVVIQIRTMNKGIITAPSQHFYLYYDNQSFYYIDTTISPIPAYSSGAVTLGTGNSCVIGMNVNAGSIYVNGTARSLSSVQSPILPSATTLIHGAYSNSGFDDFVSYFAAAFYAEPLTAAQHLEIADRMLAF